MLVNSVAEGRLILLCSWRREVLSDEHERKSDGGGGQASEETEHDPVSFSSTYHQLTLRRNRE